MIVTECDVPFTPVMLLPYDDVMPYSTTEVPLAEVVQVMVTVMELTGVTTMLDIVKEGVVKAESVLHAISDELVDDVDLAL